MSQRLVGAASAAVGAAPAASTRSGADGCHLDVDRFGRPAYCVGRDTRRRGWRVDEVGEGDLAVLGEHLDRAAVEDAPVTVRDGEVTFTAYLDRSSVEVLAQDGQVSLTDLIYPPASATGVAAYAVGGTAKAVDIKVTPIRP